MQAGSICSSAAAGRATSSLVPTRPALSKPPHAHSQRFAADFAVPFTNNPAEQPQRMVKLQMKIGGCWRSVRTAARYCLIRSYLGTARNHGIHPLDALRDAMAGNPWMPPQTA